MKPLIDRRRVLFGSIATVSAMILPSLSFMKNNMAQSADLNEHVIEIKGSQFVPNSIRVRPNDIITWVNLDIVPHTATALDKSWDTKTIKKNESKSVTITSDMAVNYFCRHHPSMKASIEIID